MMIRRTTTPTVGTIRRGTTSSIILPMPYEHDYILDGFVTFVQRGAVVFEKPFSDENVTFDTGYIMVKLTQEDTLKLTTVDVVRAQARFVMKYGERAASGMAVYCVSDILKEGEI